MLKYAPPIQLTTPAGRRQDSLLVSGAPSQRPLSRLSHSACQVGVGQMRCTRDHEDSGSKAGFWKGVSV
jgi:hypothetical protein